jgi:hypothetical protein
MVWSQLAWALLVALSRPNAHVPRRGSRETSPCSRKATSAVSATPTFLGSSSTGLATVTSPSLRRSPRRPRDTRRTASSTRDETTGPSTSRPAAGRQEHTDTRPRRAFSVFLLSHRRAVSPSVVPLRSRPRCLNQARVEPPARLARVGRNRTGGGCGANVLRSGEAGGGKLRWITQREPHSKSWEPCCPWRPIYRV